MDDIKNEPLIVGTTFMKTVYPLQLEWEPRVDITAYELAVCLKYFGGTYYPGDLDVTLHHFMNFKITDHNK